MYDQYIMTLECLFIRNMGFHHAIFLTLTTLLRLQAFCKFKYLFVILFYYVFYYVVLFKSVCNFTLGQYLYWSDLGVYL